MKKLLAIFICWLALNPVSGQSGKMNKAAAQFISLLDQSQRDKAVFVFDTLERSNWHFVPLDDRKGIEMNRLSEKQRAAAMDLFKTGLSENGLSKVAAIMQLELVLKSLEKRGDSDHYRD